MSLWERPRCAGANVSPMKYLSPYPIGVSNVKMLQRVCSSALVGVISLSVFAGNARAEVVAAGELILDLKAADLFGSNTSWFNHDVDGDTVGDLSTFSGGTLSVAANVDDGTRNVPFALQVGGDSATAVVAAVPSPASVIGNETRSVEAWVLSPSGGGTQTPVSLGNTSSSMHSAFNYSNGGNGMFNGWANDAGWRLDQANDPITQVIAGEWVHVAWTYDGTTVRGYRNGVLTGLFDPADGDMNGMPLETADNPISVGAGTGGRDPISGYIADVRVHTGVLSDADVLNNFNEPISTPDDSEVGCVVVGSGSCDSADLAILRENLFSAGDGSMGDIDRSGFIDWRDWRLFKDDMDRVVTPAGLATIGAVAQTPEPSSILVLGVGAAVLGASGARRRAL